MTNNFYAIIKKLLSKNISDIHILQDNDIYVRNEIGDMVRVKGTKIEKDEIWGFINDILDSRQQEMVLDGYEMDTAVDICNVRLRVNIYNDNVGIRVAMRKINTDPPALEDIGFDDNIKKYLMKSKGLIIVTGATGSGKSTSVASMIDYINQNRKVHIITLEDPIEYVFKNKKALVTQRQIVGGKWLSAIKSAMRQDPDIIMVGEMRDAETIKAVLTLVETGHLVITTLHTMSASQTITRIIDNFPKGEQDQVGLQLSLCLEMIISQDLIKTKNRSGKTAAREILLNTSSVSNNIRDKKVHQLESTIETGMKHGMKTMDRSLAELLAEGKIDLETILPKIKDLKGFKAILENLGLSMDEEIQE